MHIEINAPQRTLEDISLKVDWQNGTIGKYLFVNTY